MDPAGFIGVHAGAGRHSLRSTDAYLKICHKACEEGAAVLRLGRSVLEAATAATIILENSPLTNAGFGSNLTWDGHVECDAMVMDGHSLHFGAVGAVAGITNPVLLAKYLCTEQCKRDLPYGKIRPCIVVGDGARNMACRAGIPTVLPSALITDRSLKLHNRLKGRFEGQEAKKRRKIDCPVPLDTVGAVCVDRDGNVAATCSSGGILLKDAGRLGQSAAYGCGCWAENSSLGRPAVASSTTGCGEYLIRTMLGQEMARTVQTSECPVTAANFVMNSKFLESPFLHDIEEKLAGVIVLKSMPGESGGEFLWSHTSSTMCIGSMNTNDRRAQVRMSRLPSGMTAGSKVLVEGMKFSW